MPLKVDDPVLRAGPYVAATVAVVLLVVSGVLPAWPGLCHEVALPPLDLVSDLAILLSRASSLSVFILGLLGDIVIRSFLLATVFGLSRRRFGQMLRFYLLALPLALVAAGLIDTGQTALYAISFWLGLGVAALLFLALAPSPWRSGAGGRLASLRSGGRLPTLVVYFVLLGALGGGARIGGTAAEVVAVPASAALTVVAARRLARPGPTGWVRGLVVLSVVAAVLASVLAVEVFEGPRSSVGAAVPARRGSLFLVPGLDTSSGRGTLYDLDPGTLGFSCAQTYYFSYAGPGIGARQGRARCPIRTGRPYTRGQTQAPLVRLVANFRSELSQIPGPVTVVAHSTGSWVAWAALAGTGRGAGAAQSGSGGAGGSSGRPRVRELVLLSPVSDPLGYPSSGLSGAGAVGADGARLVTYLARLDHFSTFRLNGALPEELMADPPALARLLDGRLPSGTRALAVSAAYDLPLLVGVRHPFARAEEACPVTAGHSGLVTSPATAVAVDDFLSGRPLPSCGPWRTWPGALAAGYRTPDR